MNIVFQIELPKDEFILQESIPIKFRLANNGDPVGIPLEYKSSDVVALSLFDNESRLIARADGYTKSIRLDPAGERIAQADMRTEELGAGQAMEWEDNLLRYMDIEAPGRYFVQARFQFQPGNISLESQKGMLQISENSCDWMDVLRDQVSMGMMYFVQQHSSATDTRTLFQISNGFQLTTLWEGGNITLPSGLRPKFSEAGFATQNTFEHDFFRWLLWIEQGKLFATSFTGSKPLGKNYEYSPGQGNITLIGRPIQHMDKGVSALLLESGNGRYRAVQLDFDSGFRNTRRSVLISFDSRPSPLSAASDWLGQIYLTAGHAGNLPIDLFEAADGKITRRARVLSQSNFPDFRIAKPRVLKAFPDVRVYSASVRAVLAVVLLEREGGRNLKLIRIPLDTDEQKPQSVDVPIPSGALSMGEGLVSADIVQTQKAELHAIFSTSLGNIFYVRNGTEPQRIVRVDPDKAALSRIVVSAQSDIYAFFPVNGRGIGHQLLYRRIRR